MKIANSALQFESSHSQLMQHEISESTRMWIGNRRPGPLAVGAGNRGANEASDSRQALLDSARVDISDVGRSTQAAGATQSGSIGKLYLIRALLSRMIGKDIEIFDAGKLGNAQTAASKTGDVGFGIEYERHESYTEAEQMNFSASGVIQTADGKSIDFSLSMSMERYYHEESDLSIQLGNARKTNDPLVINFSGNAAQLTDQRFAFDLNSDGNASERINYLGSGSGFLAFDRNGDGKINDGSELFGAKTGNGFAELAALDGDHNGWIDESDEAFAYLSIWIKDSSGTDLLRSLKDMGIGAISLSNVNSPFSIKDDNNHLQGQIQASGIYFWEDGRVGSIQQIDLTV